MSFRVGQGFDSHPYSSDPDRAMVLGGVSFDGPGLAGHSDADAIAHACTDALLGAAGLGDIGSWFPDTDSQFAGADSIELLRTVVEAIRTEGWAPVNLDCSVVAATPKLAPQREAMQAVLSKTVGAPVTVKGKRPEGIAVDGVACWCVALIETAEGEAS